MRHATGPQPASILGIGLNLSLPLLVSLWVDFSEAGGAELDARESAQLEQLDVAVKRMARLEDPGDDMPVASRDRFEGKAGIAILEPIVPDALSLIASTPVLKVAGCFQPRRRILLAVPCPQRATSESLTGGGRSIYRKRHWREMKFEPVLGKLRID